MIYRFVAIGQKGILLFYNHFAAAALHKILTQTARHQARAADAWFSCLCVQYVKTFEPILKQNYEQQPFLIAQLSPQEKCREF